MIGTAPDEQNIVAAITRDAVDFSQPFYSALGAELVEIDLPEPTVTPEPGVKLAFE